MHQLKIVTRSITALFLGGLLMACSQAQLYQRPDAPLPIEFSVASETSPAAVSPDWWTAFDSQQLNVLVQLAVTENLDLRAAVARIDQARSALTISSAGLYPDVSAFGSAIESGSDSYDSWRSSYSDQWAVGMVYELDLWGGNSAARNAALARLDMSEWNRAIVGLALQASVANSYFLILALTEQLDIAQQNTDAAKKLMNLVQVRYDSGAATALEMAQQKTTLLAISARTPILEQSLANARNALAVLLGGTLPAISESAVATLTVPAPSPGVPKALLESRPEIRAAEAGLVAASANVGAARATLLPSVQLSLSSGVADVFTAGTSAFASLAGSLGQVLFNGGALRAQVDLTQAVQAELTAVYLQTVLIGVQEVEDGLAAQRSAEESVRILEETAYQSREVYRLALIRFDAGGEDFLNLLDAQRTRLAAEESLVLAQYNRLAAAVQLYKAIGGGWSDEQSI